jgi:TIR domain
MAETRPIQIFLCHASEDKAAVLDIYDRLKALGYKPWLDKKGPGPGQRWRCAGKSSARLVAVPSRERP